MARAVEIFTPTDVPTYTYVQRTDQGLEKRLREAFEIPKMVISVSGPSKCGKTVLINKAVAAEDLITVSGASIRSSEDLWRMVLDWMEVPTSRTEKTGTTISGGLEAKGGGSLSIPLVAQGSAEAKGNVGAERNWESSETFSSNSMAQVMREIANSTFVVFIDDFHYIPKDIQQDIGKQIKMAAEKGVRICTASVPHRSDDVVRSNPELRGRVTAIDLEYWSSADLEEIARLGFNELHASVDAAVISRMAAEAFGSPQLMQAICLHTCFENALMEPPVELKTVEIAETDIKKIFERTSTLTDFSTMLATLHSGPKLRGTERKEFDFTDGTKGDVYRCVLLALKSDPPRLSFPYDEILKRTQAVCTSDRPAGSSVVQALAQIDALATNVQSARVIEWDENVFDIVEPYFLFFLRSSSYLASLGERSQQ